MIDGATACSEFMKMTRIQNMNIDSSKPLALKKLLNIHIDEFSPHLIYYSLRCPFRLIDLDFMNTKQKKYVKNLISNSSTGIHKEMHLLVLDKISKTVRELYSNNIVHNALTTHNITCALEIIDFETSFEINKTDKDLENKLSLIPREIVQLQEIAFAVSWWFQESYRIDKVEKILDQNGLLHYSFKHVQE